MMNGFKRPRITVNRSYQINVADDEIPLLRIWIVSARGLPRSAGAVGMPDPYVTVKFNGEKVGTTKADRGTRRPEWNQNFLIRSDLSEGGTGGGGGRGGDDGDASSSDDCFYGEQGMVWDGHEGPLCPAASRCGRGGIGRGADEVLLEVWDQYVRDDDGGPAATDGGGARKKPRRSSTSKPNDIYDDRLFDVSFVSRCFQKGALRRVQGAVIGGDRLLGVCRIPSSELRALGSSTVPADLKLRDPSGSWWSGSRGTVRVAVSLERLQASVIRAAFPSNRMPLGVPLGAGVGAGGIKRVALQEAKGEETMPPADLSCKVLWNGQDFSSPSRWDKVFCMTSAKNQLWLDAREEPPDFASSQQASPVVWSRRRNSLAPAADIDTPTTGGIAEAKPLVPMAAKDEQGAAASNRAGVTMDGISSVTGAALAVSAVDAVPIADVDCLETLHDSPAGSPHSREQDGRDCQGDGQRQRRESRKERSPQKRRLTLLRQQEQVHHPLTPGSAVAEDGGVERTADRIPHQTDEATAVENDKATDRNRTAAKTAVAVEDCSAYHSCAHAGVAAAAAGGNSLATRREGASVIPTSPTVAAGSSSLPTAVSPAAASSSRPVASTTPVTPSPVVTIAAAVATAAAAPAAVLIEGVLAVARSAARPTGRRRLSQQQQQEEEEEEGGREEDRRRSAVAEASCTDPRHRSCVLRVGLLYHLSTFDAQGLADMLNSGDESTERMAGTKEWHDMGFRLHWDPTRRRFTILNVSRRSFVLRSRRSSLATGLLGFGDKDHESAPVPEALLDPQHPSDPPRRHMGVTGDVLPPPLVRPHWMRVLWGPPAMEITRGGELRIQLWARPPAGSILKAFQRRRRRRSALSAQGQADDGSWLVGTAVLDSTEVCRLATGKPTKLPLLSPPALWKYERSKSAAFAEASAAATAAAAAAAAAASAVSTCAENSESSATTTTSLALAASNTGRPSSWVAALARGKGAGFWSKAAMAPRVFLSRKRQWLRGLKRRLAGAGAESNMHQTPVGVGGARVCWVLQPPSSSRSRRSGSRIGADGSILTPVRRGKRLPAEKRGAASGKSALGGDTLSTAGASVAVREGPARTKDGTSSSGVVGHVWVSFKLRDPSMLLMKVVRQWNMARDEASVQQRVAAQMEAKRLWMFMPGISLWRVLVQIAGMSLLVSYCVTLALRAFQSTKCRSTFNCMEETDPTLASLREWQTVADNMLSALSFLDMLLQFRTGYVDKNSKIVMDPKKVGLHYLRTWFIPDLWCSLPYGTMQPLLQPLLDEVEGAADLLTSAHAEHAAGAAMPETFVKAADSPLSVWVMKLSKRLHIGKINSIRGTQAFKYLDDSAMGVDLAVKQVVHFVRGRRRVLRWLGNPPKQRGRIGKFFFRVGVTNKWTRIVLSYRLLGYAKVIGTLMRAMRVLALAVRAVPRATRVLRLAAVFIRSYAGRRRSKDLHEASIVIQRRAGRHMALKVAGQLKTNLRRRARASSDSDIVTSSISSSAAAVAAAADGAAAYGGSALDDDGGRSRGVSDAALPSSSSSRANESGVFGGSGTGDKRGHRYTTSPLRPPPRRRRDAPTPSRSPSVSSDGGGYGGGGSVGWATSGRMYYPPLSSIRRTSMSISSDTFDRGGGESRRSPSMIPSEDWSECSWDEVHDPRSPPRMSALWTGAGDDSAVTPTTPPYGGAASNPNSMEASPAWAPFDPHRTPPRLD